MLCLEKINHRKCDIFIPPPPTFSHTHTKLNVRLINKLLKCGILDVLGQRNRNFSLMIDDVDAQVIGNTVYYWIKY